LPEYFYSLQNWDAPHLQTAFTNFFAGRTKYPNFKKKHQGGSAEWEHLTFAMSINT